MAAPKKPQDHQSKKTAAVVVQGITLDTARDELEARASDWDVIEGLALVEDPTIPDEDKLVPLVRVTRTMLGDDYERVRRELRTANDGKLDVEMMSQFVRSTFEALNPNA